MKQHQPSGKVIVRQRRQLLGEIVCLLSNTYGDCSGKRKQMLVVVQLVFDLHQQCQHRFDGNVLHIVVVHKLSKYVLHRIHQMLDRSTLALQYWKLMVTSIIHGQFDGVELAWCLMVRIILLDVRQKHIKIALLVRWHNEVGQQFEHRTQKITIDTQM